MRDNRLWWDGCSGIGGPPAHRRLIPLGKIIRSEGWVFSRKKDKPTQRGEAGPAPPPPGLTLPSAGLSPCLLHPCRAGWQGAKISVGANTRVGDQSFTGVPWGLGTLPGCLLPNLGEKQVKGIFVFLVYIFFFPLQGHG